MSNIAITISSRQSLIYFLPIICVNSAIGTFLLVTISTLCHPIGSCSGVSYYKCCTTLASLTLNKCDNVQAPVGCTHRLSSNWYIERKSPQRRPSADLGLTASDMAVGALGVGP